KDPVSSVNVDEIVALGASLYAAYKGDQSKLSATQKSSIKKIKVSESTAMCFGTLALNYDENRQDTSLSVSILIEKNEKIPCSVTKSFVTSHDGQEIINCRITESKSSETDPRFVNILFEERLSLPSNRPAGQEIQITYSFDDNQTMHASFLDVESKKETKTSLSIIQVSDDSSNKIDKFIVE
ncbi:MAG TPA: Hsp70 family protein, partial [Gammaproteobacteria bacterium]|nr:Hsp70 family protein [Gammaproteobacteria bacterium]